MNVGGPEIVLIFIVALIVFGPKRMPEIGRKIGLAIRELRRATMEFRTNVEREIGIDPVTGLETIGRARRDILTTVSDPLKDVARETIGTVRELRAAVGTAARDAQEKPASSDRQSTGRSDPGPRETSETGSTAEPLPSPAAPSGRPVGDASRDLPQAPTGEGAPPLAPQSDAPSMPGGGETVDRSHPADARPTERGERDRQE